MKKHIALSLTEIICLLFTIGTIISIFIVYKNIENTVVIFGFINYGLDYVFRPAKIDLLREFSIPFGLKTSIIV